MDDPVATNRLVWDERATIHARDTTGDYMLARFRAGEDALNEIEAAGLDFSGEALSVARQLARETGLAATFVQGTVDEAPRLAPGPFDMVFTTWGTICWLPSVRSWSHAIASVLAPGGELYFADTHPSLRVLEQSPAGLVVAHDYLTPVDQPLTFVDANTYTGDTTVMSNQTSHEWIHPLSAILGGLIDNGMMITMFREHEVLPWKALPCMVPEGPRMWRLPEGSPRMPLSFSLRARKGGVFQR